MNYKVLGPPGTGKTKTLLKKVIEYKTKGIPLDRIGYFAFTRKAAYEARDRFLEAFPELNKKDVKHFRTLHLSLYHGLQLDILLNRKAQHFSMFKVLKMRYQADPQSIIISAEYIYLF